MRSRPGGIPGTMLLRVSAAAILLAGAASAQGTERDSLPSASACWIFTFGRWEPPLDWTRSGHPGRASDMAQRVLQARDSVYVQDARAAANSAMIWERSEGRLMLLLFPSWWPVGVSVRFDSAQPDTGVLAGLATALVADAAQTPSRARIRTRQVSCGASEPGRPGER